MLINQTTIDKKAMIALAKISRKTLRKKRSRPVRRFAWFAVAVECLLMALNLRVGDGGWAVNALLAAIMLACVFGEDTVNGLLAFRQVLPNSREVNITFREDFYVQRTQPAETWWDYRQVKAIGEDKDFFALVIDTSHGQILSKKGFEWGGPEEFRTFIQRKTGRKIQKVASGQPKKKTDERREKDGTTADKDTHGV